MGAAAFTRGSDATALLIQITVATPRVNQRDATELDTMLLSIYVHSLLTHTHTFSPTNEAFRPPPIRPAQHRCDKGGD